MDLDLDNDNGITENEPGIDSGDQGAMAPELAAVQVARGKKRNRQILRSFSSYIYRLGQVVKPHHLEGHLGMTKSSMAALNKITNMVAEQIIDRALTILKCSKRRTLNSRDVKNAMLSWLSLAPAPPPDAEGNVGQRISDYAINAIAKALLKFHSAALTSAAAANLTKGKNKDLANVKTDKTLKTTATRKMSAKAGLILPVRRFDRMIRARGAPRVSVDAAVAVTAGVEYLLTELIEVAAQYTTAANRSRLTQQHMTLALRDDAPLAFALRGISFSCGGICTKAKDTVPPVAQEPAPKANVARTSRKAPARRQSKKASAKAKTKAKAAPKLEPEPEPELEPSEEAVADME